MQQIEMALDSSLFPPSFHSVGSHSRHETQALHTPTYTERANPRLMIPVHYPAVTRPMMSSPSPGSRPMMSANSNGNRPLPMEVPSARSLLPLSPSESRPMVQVHSSPDSRTMMPIQSTNMMIPILSHYPFVPKNFDTISTNTAAFGCARVQSSAYFEPCSSLQNVQTYQYAPVAYNQYPSKVSMDDYERRCSIPTPSRMDSMKRFDQHADDDMRMFSRSFQTEYEEMDCANMTSEESLDSRNSSVSLPQRRGVGICKYYVKHGICSFGARCIFDHPLDSVPTHPIMPTVTNSSWHHVIPPEPVCNEFSSDGSSQVQVAYNSHGYPSRPGAEPCSFYQRTGECQYSRTCKYDHPEYIGILEERVPIAGFNAQNLPLRPEAQLCAYFTKTGHCRFGSTCKWSHPELTDDERGDLFDASSKLNGKGYPLRQGANTCTFYKQRGYCSYGAACKFDHPMD